MDTSDTYNKIAELLLENKADANEFKGTSPLELAVEASNLKLVALLLPITEKKDVVGYVSGKPVLNCFLDHQGNVNAVDKHGKTALHRGAVHGNISAIRYLLEHNAEIDIRDNQMQTPLHCAATYGKELSGK